MRDDLTGSTDVLGEQFMRKRRHVYRAVFVDGAEPLRKTNQRPRQAAGDIIHAEAFNAMREIDGALYQDLQKRDSQERTMHDDLFDLRCRPGHQLGVFECRGLLTPVWKIQE